jgi:hypothetical protein
LLLLIVALLLLNGFSRSWVGSWRGHY